MKRDLRSLDVPEHRDGFWEDLGTRLAGEPQELPLPSEPRRLPGWLLAPAAAAVVAVAALGVSGLLGGDDPGLEPAETAVVPASTDPVETTVPASQLPDAPWSVPPPVAAATVPPDLIEEWSTAENRTWCSALTIDDPQLIAGNTPRGAQFEGGWGVAWDGADGRSVFGVAGAGMVFEEELATRWPTVQRYADGSVVGYGGEGLDPDNPRRLAEFVVAGQGCMYQAWSELGDDHLASVLAALRFVEGLQAESVELVTSVDVRAGGAAPWTAAGGDVPGLALQLRSAAGLSGPLLWPATVGFDDATLRSTAVGEWGVAWDVPGRPGHDAFNFPCESCGRGVVGFAEYGPSEALSAPVGRPLLIEYADGSYVEIGYYVGDDRLPADRLQFADRETGALVGGGYEARIVRADMATEYVLWSHLGLDHLLGLVDGLREVTAAD